MNEVHMKMIESWLVVEVWKNFAALDVELFLDRVQTLISDSLEQGQVLTLQITNSLQVTLFGQSKAVECLDVTLVELIVFL